MENGKHCLQQPRKICSIILSGLLDQLTDHLVLIMLVYVPYMHSSFRLFSQRGKVTLPKLVGAVGPWFPRMCPRTLMLMRKARGAPFDTILDHFCARPFFRIGAT